MAVSDRAAIVPWVLSGHSAQALRGQARKLSAHVDAGRAMDIVSSLPISRAALNHRAVILGDGEDRAAGLMALASGGAHPCVVAGSALADARLVFVFPGQGQQWRGMGGELLDKSPAFAAQAMACADALRAYVEWDRLRSCATLARRCGSGPT